LLVDYSTESSFCDKRYLDLYYSIFFFLSPPFSHLDQDCNKKMSCIDQK